MTRAEFHRLADVPPEAEWFANLDNPNTRRAYRNDVGEFVRFAAIERPEDFRVVTRAHVLRWRKDLEARTLSPATIRRKLSALSDLFDYLCEKNAIAHNPVKGVKRPKEGANEGKTPAITDTQARQLLDAPRADTLKGKRDRAILAVLLYHALRRAELCALRMEDYAPRRGIVTLRVRGKGGKIRYVPVKPAAITRIEEYLDAAGHRAESDGPLFRPVKRSDGKLNAPLSGEAIYVNVVLPYAKRLGFAPEGFGPHALRTTATTNALGFTNGFTYDGAGNLLTIKDALGVLTSHLYDQYGNLTNAVTGSAAPSAFAYDDNGNRLTEVQLTPSTLQPLTTNTFLYDAQNRVIASIDSFGRTNQTTYNEIGRTEEIIDKLGRTNRYDYDLRGNLGLVTYTDGTTEQYAYDAEGRRTNSVDRAGRVTAFIFDALGRLTQTLYTDNTSTRTIYDAAGRVQFTVDARGVTNAFGYDAAGRRIATTNAWGTAVAQWSTNAYDAGGNMIAAGDALGRVTRYTYDALNQRTQTIFPDNTAQTTIYNGNGQRVGEVDQAGVTNRFGYHSSLGTLQAATNAWGTTSATWATYAFDPLGRQTNQVDALGRKTTFELDAEGQRLRRILPGNQWEGFKRDASGNVLAHTNFINGLIITNHYDSQNRLIGVWHGSTQLVSYAFGLTGVRTQMFDSSGTYVWIYDNRDRVRTNITPAGTLYYDYDANGNLTNLVSATANGVSIAYQYDALNRITNVIDNRLGLATKNVRYQFDGVGNLSAIAYPNGATNLWQYDTLNRLTNEVWKAGEAALASFAYQLDATGKRTNLNETVNGASRTFSWRYDAARRLTNELILGASPTGYVMYAYDVVGNRTNRASTLAGITNQVFSYNTNDGLTIDAYDSAGNTCTNSGNVFLYDWANRLTNAVLGTTNVSIVYNGDGQRVKKSVVVGTTTNTTLYLVDELNPTGYAQVLEEKSVVGTATNLVKAFVYGLNLISQRILNVTTNFYGTDGIGSTRFLLNLAGAVSDTYSYDAFGTIIASTGTTTNDYLFQGEQRDADLRLASHRARYYAPGLGRWWTMDSFEGRKNRPMSLHKFSFVRNNPLNLSDPSGHNETLPGLSVANAVYFTLATIALYSFAEVVRRTGPVTMPSIDWAPAKFEPLPAPKPERKPPEVYPPPVPPFDDDSEDLLYRGVPKTREDDYRRALLGVAIPRGRRLDFDALTLHVKGEEVASGVTSWTIRRDVARRFSGSDGIILEIDLFTVADRMVPRPSVVQYSDEHEILLKGVISGARPTQP